MCLFLYPVPKNKKSKKVKKLATTKTASGESIQEDTYWIADEALQQGAEAAIMPRPHGYWVPFGAEQRFEEYEPGYITKAQWASHGETLKGTLTAAKETGNKIDGLKGFVSSGMVESRDAIKNTQGAIKGTHLAINDTYAAVEDVHNSLKMTYEAIKKNHSEYSNKQDECAAEIAKVRKLLEEEAKKREEAHRKQQNIEEAWNYYQRFRQAEQDAEPKSSRSSTRSHSSSHSESNPFYRCRVDPWGAWHHHHSPFAGWDKFYDGNIDDDFGHHRPPPPPPPPAAPRPPYNAARGNRRPRHFQGWL
ncbi:hypothetical protein F5Y06DRAFT_165240 [Hypoxylon sp. FL0890]|nr:hypothetical protein F5Y06DRAFT_165240 [Hypoxylon sp. FL0890]